MTLLTSAKCARSVRKIDTLTTSSRLEPLASTMAFMFSNTRRTWASMSPLTNSLVAGSRGIWPETHMVLPTLVACEYVPIAAGALVVEMICLLIAFISVMEEILACKALAFSSQGSGYPLHVRHPANGSKDAGEMLAVANLNLKFQRGT